MLDGKRRRRRMMKTGRKRSKTDLGKRRMPLK